MKSRLSAFTLVLMMGVMIYATTGFYARYRQPAGNATIAWDAAGYYWYLPSIFIYHDLARQSWADSLIKKYEPGPGSVEGLGFRAANGNVVMKYPAGMAVAEAPFFFIAHGLAKPLGYAADGFSRPYQVAIQLGALLVGFIGLWLMRRLLLFYYADGIVAAILFLLVIGSNYLNYASIDGSISHTWLFTVYAAILLCTRSFYIRQTWAGAAAIGACCGLAILIRPTELISFLIPLLWGLPSVRPSDLRERFRFLLSRFPKILLTGLVAAAIVSVQLIYWKAVAGNWLVYSYQDQGFSWLQPHFFDYTFSYRSGWITYTPVMLLSLIGFIPFLRSGANRPMAAIFFAAAFYLVCAWDIWWYAGTGGRAMIQYYPVLLFPMASLLEWIAKRRLRIVVAWPFILLFAYVNVWFTYQAHGGGLYDAEGMSRAYYWRVIGRWSAPYETQKLKDGDFLYEPPMPATARLIYSNSLHQKTAVGSDSVLTMGGTTDSSAQYFFPLCRNAGEHWVRAAATFQCFDREGRPYNMTGFLLGAWKGRERRLETAMSAQRFLHDNETKELCVDLKLPESLDADSLNVHFWNRGSDKKILIENLEVWVF